MCSLSITRLSFLLSLSSVPLQLTLHRIDYSPSTKKLIISCVSAEHNFMAGIGREIMTLVNSDNNDFTGNNPDYEIIENSDSGTISDTPPQEHLLTTTPG